MRIAPNPKAEVPNAARAIQRGSCVAATLQLKHSASIGFALWALIASACISESKSLAQDLGDQAIAARHAALTRDPHSFARPEEARVTHANLHWTVDFSRQKLSGAVTWSFENRNGQATHLYLDTKALQILDVRVGDDVQLRTTPYSFGEPDRVRGRALIIPIASTDERVFIRYVTTEEGTALQWIAGDPRQKRAPMLLCDTPPIHARCLLPCQDSPAVGFTFEAAVSAPRDLRVLLPAARRGDDAGATRFRMDRPVASHHLTLAVGDFAMATLGPRTAVYAQAHRLAAAKAELAGAEAMLALAESWLGPFPYPRHDILIAPALFPRVSAEYPRLTILSETALDGSRRLASLPTHLLTRAWAGHSMRPTTWADAWISQGLALYWQRRLHEAQSSPKEAAIEATVGYHRLEAELRVLSSEESLLHLNLEGRSPEAALGTAIQEKSALFWRALEDRLGRESFDAFVKTLLANHAHRTLTTAELESLLFAQPQVAEDESFKRTLRQWIYASGLPSDANRPFAKEFRDPDRLADAYGRGEVEVVAIAQSGWEHFAQIIRFVDRVPAKTPAAQIAALHRDLGFANTPNIELQATFLRSALRAGYFDLVQELPVFLTNQGRTDLLLPIYRELLAKEPHASFARQAYATARPGYHPALREVLDPLLLRETEP